MCLRSNKELPEMERSNHTTAATNDASTSDSMTNPPSSQNDTQTIPFSSLQMYKIFLTACTRSPQCCQI